MLREVALVVVAGVFSWLVVPAMLGQPVALPLLFVGLFLGLTFMPMYGLSLLAGKRLPDLGRLWIGIFAWFFAFGSNISVLGRLSGLGLKLTPVALFLEAGPPVFGVLLVLLAALKAPAGRRLSQAAWALYVYSVPMVIVRELLVRLVSMNQVLSVTAMQAAALYMFLHALLRIYFPTLIEQEERTEPLVRRSAVPDSVVGLVEGTLRRAARPYATTADGRDNDAISVLCRPDEVSEVVERLAATLADRPFEAVPGESVKDKVEVVVRRRA